MLESINEYLNFSQDDRLFCLTAQLWLWPVSVVFGGACWATLVLERSFAYPAQAFKRMHDEAVTSFASVPTAYADDASAGCQATAVLSQCSASD